TLRSGQVAGEYFDKYRFESQPRLLDEIAAEMVPLIPTDTEVLAGLELGGVPIATALSLRTGIPAAFVRKQAKTYGTARLAEGIDVDGKVVTVVEDVITTGGQVVISTNQLRDLGAIVSHVVCVIDRSPDGAGALVGAGLTVAALLTKAQLDEAESRRR
ncbi:MAG: phosphoribosyltransferase family protein, partial [Ilumatobacteraceae bacterium]